MAVEGKKHKNTKGNLSNNLERKFSASEPDLITANKYPQKSGFPPGITVDELWLYRRKAPGNFLPQDNIKLDEGTFKQLKTEYKRRYKNYYPCYPDADPEQHPSRSHAIIPENNLKLEGSQEFLAEYNESFIERPVERAEIEPTAKSFEIIDPMKMDQTSLRRQNSFPPPSNPLDNFKKRWPPLNRHPTNLKIEGDILFTTESSEKFIEFLLSARPDLQRKRTSLRLEGEMETKTENREQYIPYELENRPPLCKKLTNLHIGTGDMDSLTENQDKYRSYEVQRRPPLVKKSTNLHLEGEFTMTPEYRCEYVNYNSLERAKPVVPVNNLKSSGFYASNPEINNVKYKNITSIPNLRENIGVPFEPSSGTRFEKSNTNFSTVNPSSSHQNLIMPTTSKEVNTQIENALLSNQRKSPATLGRRLQSQLKCTAQPNVGLDTKVPREEKMVQRPRNKVASEPKIDHLAEEQLDQFIPYPDCPTPDFSIKKPDLKSDGRFQCQPEYRKAYVDYLIRENVERNPRTVDFLQRTPIRRAYELVDEEKTSKVETNIIIPSQVPSDDNTTTAPSSTSSISTVQPPPSHRNSSLTKIETTMFGSKLPTPSGESSAKNRTSVRRRSSTTRTGLANISSNSPSADLPRVKQKKYNNIIRVENLACRSTSDNERTPATNLEVSHWIRDDSTKKDDTAFYVLDYDSRDCRNEGLRKRRN